MQTKEVTIRNPHVQHEHLNVCILKSGKMKVEMPIRKVNKRQKIIQTEGTTKLDSNILGLPSPQINRTRTKNMTKIVFD